MKQSHKKRLAMKFPMKDLFSSLSIIGRLKLIDAKNAVLLALLTILVFLTEALGLSLIYPILEYIEAGRDLSVLMEKSVVWIYLDVFFSSLGLEISIDLLFLSILIATGARAILSFANQKLQINVQLGITSNLRMNYYQAILLARKSYLDTLNSGNVLETFNNLARSGGGLLTAVLRIQQVVVALTIYLVVVLVAQPLVTLYMVLFGVIASLLTSQYRLKMETVTSQLVMQNELISQKVGMTLRVWRSLKSSVARQQSLSFFNEINSKWKDLVFNVLIQAARSQRLLVPVSAAMILSVLYVTTIYLDTSIAFISFFAITFLRVQPLMTNLIASRQHLSQNLAKLELYERYFSEALIEQEKSRGKRLHKGMSLGVEFEGVSFRHPKTRKYILKDFSIYVPQGMTVGIFGPSGVGKTTFLDLISRFNIPEEGKISIDGQNIDTLKLDSLRDDIFYLDQGSTLLDDTVEGSVGFGQKNIEKNSISEALRKTYSSKFVGRLENGALTFLGENGAKLSGGQKQRILLSRLFVSNARLILLDEPTNGLDKRTERLVLQKIKEHQKALGATMFLVSHNPLPKDFADIVINVEDILD